MGTRDDDERAAAPQDAQNRTEFLLSRDLRPDERTTDQ